MYNLIDTTLKMQIKSVPGLLLPTVQPMSAATPRLSAIQNQKEMNNLQNSLINSTGGASRGASKVKRRKIIRKRNLKSKSRGGAVTVPQFQMTYKPIGGPGQTPNDVVKNISQTSTQGYANSVYDNEVYGDGYPKSQAMKGGKRKTRKTQSKKTKTRKSRRTRRNKGGNPNWKWGCYSGGLA